MTEKVVRDNEEWHRILSPEQYRVLRESGTEAPFTCAYVDLDDEGVYLCGACGNPLFKSKTKYHSGCGWPSFWDPIAPDAVGEFPDTSHGRDRIEIRCGRCGSHLGHRFEDGPKPTGIRYCMNSIALDFDAGAEE